MIIDKLIKCVWILLLLFFVSRIYYRATDDFRLGSIVFSKEMAISKGMGLSSILNQPFHYLAKGSQSYAFESEDGRYVLKFFKSKHFEPSLFDRFLGKEGKKRKRFDELMQGYQTAFDSFREESALIAFQGTPSESNGFVTVYDKLGIKREIPLQSVRFAVQKKGQVTRDALAAALKEKNVAKAKELIFQVFDLYVLGYRQGYYDKDRGVLQNTGFVEGKAVHLDVGKLTYDPKIKQKEALFQVVKKFEYWIGQHFPDSLNDLSVAMHEYSENYSSL